MKHLCKYLSIAAAVLTPLLAGCSTSPSDAVEGQYTLEAQSVQINGVIINLEDWPGSSVTLSPVDENGVIVSIDSLLPGFDSIAVGAEAVKDGKSRYSFSSYDPYYIQDREIQVSGSVRNGKMSLSVSDISHSPVTGRWMPATGSDGLIKMQLIFSSPLASEISLGDITLPMETAVSILSALIRTTASSALPDLHYVELDRTGYVNISWSGNINPSLEPALAGVVQYWGEPESSSFHLYLRRAIADGLGLSTSPLDLTLRYFPKEDNHTIGIGLDRVTAAPLALAFSNALKPMTYAAYTEAGSPLGDLSEDSFNRLKSTAAMLATALALPSTEFIIEFELSRL